jgi:hypothetical protein
MDEAFWLVCNEPEPMLEYLIAKPSDRKLRLFAVAYYRHIGHLFTDTRSWEAVEFADQYADGRATTKQLNDHDWGTSKEPTYVVSANAWEAAAATSAYGIQLVVQAMIASDQEARAVWESAFKQTVQQGKGLLEAKVAADTVAPAEWVARQQTAERDEQRFQCNLLRDIVGNPFRPVTFDPSWRSANVVSLAQTIYDERAFDRMGILADALEESGCTNQGEIVKCCG